MNKEINIAGKKIGKDHKPFIIAEMSGNHNQSLARALSIVEAAAQAGADAIKLQTYTADTMTINADRNEFKITDKKSLWYGRHLYELYEEAHTPWEWHEEIMNHAKKYGLICFSTPFDETAVDFLENLKVPAYKIASFENTDVRLLRKVAKTGKPIIVSTGISSLEDLQLTVKTLCDSGNEQFILLKCTSAYPASAADANLKTIPHMQEIFNCQIGLSDHTMGVGVAIASVVLGATMIEKHFTLSRAEGGVDSDFSLEPAELKTLVTESEAAWRALGKVTYTPTSAENNSQQFKRSLFFIKDLKLGELITEDAIGCIRPGYGLSPRYLDNILHTKVRKNVSRGEPVSLELIDIDIEV